MQNQRHPRINSKESLCLKYTIKKHIDIINDNPSKTGFFILIFLINVNTFFKNKNIDNKINYKNTSIYYDTYEC